MCSTGSLPSRSVRHPHCGLFGAIGLLAALMMAGEASAEDLFSQTTYPAGLLGRSIAVGDINGDGSADLVTSGIWSIKMLEGDGAGHFRPPITLVPSLRNLLVAVGDFVGDAALDIVSLNPSAGTESVSWNDDGRFWWSITQSTRGKSPQSIAVADLDGDMTPDLIIANTATNNVCVRFDQVQVKSRCFATSGRAPMSVVVADLDGNGILDLVTADAQSDAVSVLLGKGDVMFQPAVGYRVDRAPTSVAVGDFNGDDAPDIVATDGISNDVRVLLGDGAGRFRTGRRLAVGSRPESIAVADFNQDGALDLVVANSYSDDATVLLGEGDGSFPSAMTFAVGHLPTSVSAADFNSDGLPDFAVSNPGSQDVTIFLNRHGLGPPVEIDIKPGSESNAINLSEEGVVAVALLGGEDLDVSEVDVTTLAFGPAGAAFDHSHGPHLEDVDADGFADLVSHYRIEQTGIEFGDPETCLRGQLLDGRPFSGCDSIRTVPDMDGDQLLDVDEEAIGTHSLRFDSDGDGHGDGDEVLVMGTDPLDPLDPTLAAVREREGRRKRSR